MQLLILHTRTVAVDKAHDVFLNLLVALRMRRLLCLICHIIPECIIQLKVLDFDKWQKLLRFYLLRYQIIDLLGAEMGQHQLSFLLTQLMRISGQFIIMLVHDIKASAEQCDQQDDKHTSFQ